jgi:hypothetical protein
MSSWWKVLKHGWAQLAADFFVTGIQKLFPQYDKYLTSGGDYVEK